MMASPRSWSGHWSGASHAPPPWRPSPRTLCCMPGSVIIVDIRLTRWHWPSLPGTPGSRRRAHTSWWRSAAGHTGGWRGSQIVSSKSETSRPRIKCDNNKAADFIIIAADDVAYLADAGHVVIIVTLAEVGLYTPLQLGHMLTRTAAARNLEKGLQCNISTSYVLRSIIIFPIHRLWAIIMRGRI